MTNLSEEPLNKELLKQRYDDRYMGDYMDVDAYSTRAHEGLANYRVRQTLAEVNGQPKSILDYGCGQGKWTSLLHDIYPHADIVGIDISEVAVTKASQKFPQHKFMVFDGNRAALDNDCFDLIFSFHVLEHVLDVTASIADIARLLRPGGQACIVFPCGNKGSFEDRLVNLLQNGRELSATGESIFFYEAADGHMRRMPSDKTIDLFSKQGLAIQAEFYSGQFFASHDWLVRGTGPAYINRIFSSHEAINPFAAIKLATMRRHLLFLNRFLGYKHLDLTKRRPLLKQTAVRATQKIATFIDNSIVKLARWEWDRRRQARHGSASTWFLQKLHVRWQSMLMWRIFSHDSCALRGYGLREYL